MFGVPCRVHCRRGRVAPQFIDASTKALLARRLMRANVLNMKKRLLSAALWFYAGWTFGAMLAAVIGVSPVLGPLMGAAAAGLFAGDPRGIIWKARATAPAASAPKGFPKAA